MRKIKVENLYKSFKVFYDKGSSLKELVLFKKRRKFEKREVLKDINFEVESGEAIALIGRNGCGKSTLLKLLTRIMYPDSGSVKVNGRVSSLIELGAGFHPDMSGRENIYTNAAIFGLTREEIEKRIDRIIDFSELKDFIDNPIRTYSSGMYMRLAFSVAINVNADVLLIDEILAVGDTNFQSKCFNKLREIKKSGVTIVIVTHDLGSVESLCDRAIWIEDGYIKNIGNTIGVVDSYLDFMNDEKVNRLRKEKDRIVIKLDSIEKDNKPEENEKSLKIDYTANHFGTGAVIIKNAYILNANDEKTNVLKTGESISIHIEYVNEKKVEKANFGIGIYNLNGVCLFGTNMQLDRFDFNISSAKGSVICEISELNLLKGRYILNVAVVDEDGKPFDFYREYDRFDVLTLDKAIGEIQLNRKWSFN